MAFGWHACSAGGAYMSADMLEAHIYYMAFGGTLSAGAIYVADTLGAHIYYIAFSGTLARGTYMSG